MNKTSNSEYIVLEALWDHNKALDRYELTNILKEEPYNRDWCIGTVSTFLTRMCDKKLVQSKKIGKYIKYSPTISRGDYIKFSIDKELQKYFNKNLEELILVYLDLDDTEENAKRIKRMLSKL